MALPCILSFLTLWIAMADANTYSFLGMNKDDLRKRAEEIREHYLNGEPNVRNDRLAIDDLLSLVNNPPHRKIGEWSFNGYFNPPECNWHNLETFLGEHGIKLATVRAWHKSSDSWDYSIISYRDPKDLEDFKKIMFRKDFEKNGDVNEAFGRMLYSPESVDRFMQKTFTPEQRLLPAIDTQIQPHAESKIGKLDEIAHNVLREAGKHPKLTFAGGTCFIGVGTKMVYQGIRGFTSSKTPDESSPDAKEPDHNSATKNLLNIIGGMVELTAGAVTIRTALKGHFMQFER